jgi:hypothetical protein
MKLMVLPIKRRNVTCVFCWRLVSRSWWRREGMAKKEFHDGKKYGDGMLCSI